jgi:hypothetical protein
MSERNNLRQKKRQSISKNLGNILEDNITQANRTKVFKVPNFGFFSNKGNECGFPIFVKSRLREEELDRIDDILAHNVLTSSKEFQKKTI